MRERLVHPWRAASEAIAACREGRPADAAAELGARWLELENATTGELLRPLRVVRAFAASACTPSHDADAIEALLAPLRGTPSAGVEHLGAAWPRMRAFLEQHELAGASRIAPSADR